MIPRAALLALVATTLCACVTGPGERELPAGPPYDLFVATVQPVLEERCANPSCHGNEERPFVVYAPHRNRLDPDDTWRDTPLTDEELALGWQQARAFAGATAPGEAALLLLKPLAPSAGGVGHVGGSQFPDEDEPGAVAIAAWLRAREGTR